MIIRISFEVYIHIDGMFQSKFHFTDNNLLSYIAAARKTPRNPLCASDVLVLTNNYCGAIANALILPKQPEEHDLLCSLN